MIGVPTTVDFYFDPACPFAWIASRWILEVEGHRTIELRLHLMSLYMLNEGRDVSPQYRQVLDLTRGPARVAAAAEHQGGAGALREFYTALGQRVFGRDDHYQVLGDGLDAVIKEALAEAGLPADLATVGRSAAFDETLRTSHNAAVGPVGADAGTPIIHIDGGAFFGPVLTSIPRGTDAVRIFDGIRLLARYPHVKGLRRTVGRQLDFSATAGEPENRRNGASDGPRGKLAGH
jgi:hypothetical protein